MLLLPQCLKNSHLCKGRHDELGLLCTDCGNCNISGFLHEAETLGYVTIVAEGTTIASRLVESGKVDAIIGVGCLEVLQKMFTAVNKYSIPAIGVPLISCGCIDTKADIDWIKEEIHHFDKDSKFKLLNINNLKNKTASLFLEGQIVQILNLKGNSTDQLIVETLLAGGKRIRPLLTVLTYEAFCTQPDETVLQHLAISIECFHKASLIHDDIEDNDSTRYGRPTIHSRFGIPVAINLGDLLIGEGYRLISECDLPPKVAMDCIKVVSRGHKTLSVGQSTELMALLENKVLSLDEMLTVFENKTSAAFNVSLMLGAIAGGADEKSMGLLEVFSSLLGLTYQLKDDLDDFTMEGSLTFERSSVLIAMLNEKINVTDRPIMEDALKQNHADQLKLLMEKYDIQTMINVLIKKYLAKIDVIISGLQNTRLKLALQEIVGKTFKDYL